MFRTYGRKIGYGLLLCLGWSFTAEAQLSFDNTEPATVMSPSPVAASLFKDVNVPVNYYTGTPQISIPLHSVKGGRLSMGVELKYTASGIRVEEDAGLTGLGWDLQAGGVISRSVVGTPDEWATKGYRASAAYLKMPNPSNSDSMAAWASNISSCDLRSLTQGTLDMTPDNYFVNFNGNSAKLFFDQYDRPYTSPVKRWKITGTESTGFTIVTEDGATYLFTAVETTKDIIEQEPSGNGSTTTAPSSWFLTQVISADKADTVNLHYTAVTYNPISYNDAETRAYLQNLTTIPNTNMPSPVNIASTNTMHTVTGYLLSDMTTTDEKLVFYTSMGRLDSAGMPYKLDSLIDFSVQSDGSLRRLSSFLFSYDYYNAAASTINRRLRLLSVRNIGSGGEVGDVYQFIYGGNNVLPARNSKAQDNWGFYNGADGNSTLIPTYTDLNYITHPGGNRSTDTTRAALGLLTAIQYPTGGTTSFEYEANRYQDVPPGVKDSMSVSYSVTAATSASGDNSKDLASGSFTILDKQSVSINLTATDPNPTDPTETWYICSGTSTNSANAIWTGSIPQNNIALTLLPGTYTACVTKALTANSGQIFIQYTNNVAIPNVGAPVGGARIKRLIQSDGRTSIIKRFIYLQDSATSSGHLLNTPIYWDLEYSPASCTCDGGGKVSDYTYATIHSIPTVQLGRTQGSHICYSHITVLDGDQGENGREEYYYQFTNDAIQGGYPYAPNTSLDDFRGQLLTKQVYNAAGKLLEGDYNTYNLNNTFGYPTFNVVYGLKTGAKHTGYNYDANGCPITVGGLNFQYITVLYPVYQLWPTLASTRKAIYSSATNDSVVTIEQYVYDTVNLAVAQHTTWNSKGDTLNDYNQYPDHFAGTAVYDTMTARNMISPLVESDHYYNSLLQGKAITAYQLWPGHGGNMILPLNKQLQYLHNPLETRLQFTSYDNSGNLLSQNKSGDVPHSYVWDYWNHVPVAEVVNATPSDIAYTSFEADGTGNFSIAATARNTSSAFTGARGYDLPSGSITKSGLNSARSYIVSYWSTSGSATVNGSTATSTVTKRGWNYYEHLLAAGATTVTITGTVTIDELRLYPSDAQMTTRTVQPLVGLSSASDAAGHPSFYEYDGLARLLRIRDMDNNILKQYNYQYQVFGNTEAAWQPNGTLRCKPCPANGAYITNMQQHQEQDINPSSATYNTTRWVDDGIPGSCVITPDWENVGSPTCQTSGSNNTGYQIQPQQDMNPCSATYGQTQNIVSSTQNLTACPTCTASNCAAPVHKCINGACQTGTLQQISATYSNGKCTKTYGYYFTDGSYQTDPTKTTVTTGPCQQ